MKKIVCMLLAVILVSGCALTTIRPAKKHAKPQPVPEKKTIVEKVRESFKPGPVVVEEKEKVLPLKKETKEKILPVPEEEEIK